MPYTLSEASPELLPPDQNGSQDGSEPGNRWTLNFGRPVAAALMGVILAIGIVGPVVILGLLLR